MRFTPEDVAYLEGRGMSVEDCLEQHRVLSGPKPMVSPRRPCTLEDGLHVIPTVNDDLWSSLFEAAAREGRLGHFIPASGAATRMFRSLLHVKAQGIETLETLCLAVEEGHGELAPAIEPLTHIRDMAVWPHLVEAVPTLADCDPHQNVSLIVSAMFEHLHLDQCPKGLVPFHEAPDPEGKPRSLSTVFQWIQSLAEGVDLPAIRNTRSAMAEHLEEARALVPDSAPIVVHFTVGAHHQATFEAAVQAQLATWPAADRARCTVSFSIQDRRTDCIALNADGTLARTDEGQVLFRPGGHGALLGNLAAHGRSITLIKNIDSVVSYRHRHLVVPWRKRLVGYALHLEQHAQAFLTRFEEERAFSEAKDWLWETFGHALDDSDHLPEVLRRPIRVCGMVADEGHVGGGPYWVSDCDGYGSVHIIESAQLDMADASVRATMQEATHFNPVDIVCVMGTHFGREDALDAFADPRWWMVTEKSQGTATLRVLERPGLWNGAMAKWNTVFVELPAETFNPVKQFGDLLSQRHR